MRTVQHAPGPRHRAHHRVLWRAALLGVAAGHRASMGLAGPVLSSDAGRPARVGALIGAVGEFTGDKLPSAPSRLQPPGPQSRAVAAALGGAALARRAGRPVWSAALVAAGGSAVGTWGGAAWRTAAARRGPDWRGALIEDLAAVTLTVIACAGSARGRR